MAQPPLSSPQVLLLVVGLLGAAVAVGSEPDRFLSAANGVPPETLRELPPLPVPPPPERRPRLVVLVLDGLGLVPSRGLPALDALRARGADVDLHAAYPSFTRPALATLATGASPLLTGVRNNRWRGPVLLDTLLHRARDAGVATACVGDGIGWFSEQVGAGCESSAVTAGALEFLRTTGRVLKGPAGLVVLHWTAVDHVGHLHGGDSGQYLHQAGEAGVLVETVERLAKGRPSVLVVLADHGHSAHGGHGGLEPEVARVPLVLAGPGVRPGVRAEARAEDVAPTLAVLAGLAPPAACEGEPVWAALAVEGAARRAHEERGAAVRTRLWTAVGAVEGATGLPGFPEARAGRALAFRSWPPRAARLAIAGVVLLLLLWLSRRVAGRLPWGWLVAGGLVPAVLLGLLLGRGDPLSFSAVDRGPTFLWRVVLYLLAGGVPVFLASVGACLRTPKGARTRRMASLGLAVATAAAGPWLLAAAWAGPRPFPDLPGPTAMFLPVLLAAPAAAGLFAAGTLVSLGVWLDGAPPEDKPPAPEPARPVRGRKPARSKKTRRKGKGGRR